MKYTCFFVVIAIIILTFLSKSPFIYKKQPNSNIYNYDYPAVAATVFIFTVLAYILMRLFKIM